MKYYYYNESNKTTVCVAQCPAAYPVLDGTQCITKCPNYFSYDASGNIVCNDTCDTTTEVTYAETTYSTNGYCDTACSKYSTNYILSS